jgi:plasmid stability protein
MPKITLKNIPEPLYEQLKRTAALHRRSLNNEILSRLEISLAPWKRDTSELIEKARKARKKTAHFRLEIAGLDYAKKVGRP